MGSFGLNDWGREVVASERMWPVLLIGNGASRAVSAKFSYGLLYEAAPLSAGDRLVFDALVRERIICARRSIR
jgi:hypothetical protein